MTNNKQQTAVEWLIQNHFGGIENCTPDFRHKIEQAKEMEKQQIIQAYSNAWHDGQDAIIMTIEHIDKGGDERGLKYYEQL
jgi:hypothetical protein